MLPTTISCSTFTLRPWQMSDAASLVQHANNHNIWRNLWDAFPHPYKMDDALRWLGEISAETVTETSSSNYAIDVDGSAVGTVALDRRQDIERYSAEIGYWLGEEFWGRGIVSEAVGRITDLALAEPTLVRIFAPVFSWNERSSRLLLRNGYVRESVLKRAGFKDGHIIDRVIFARTRESEHPYTPAALV